MVVQLLKSPLSKPSVKATGSTVQVRLAGVASTLPAGSVAWTWKVCGPSPRPLRPAGEVHAARAPPSSPHRNVVPASFDEKEKVAAASLTSGFGPALIVVCGGLLSTATVWLAEVAELEEVSTARAAIDTGPSATAVESQATL